MTDAPGPTTLVSENFQRRFEQLQQELGDLQKTIAEVSENAYSPDGLVAATVGARGELIELELDPRIYRQTDARALAKTIKQTIWDASQAVTNRLLELTTPLLPDPSGRAELEQALRRVPTDQVPR